MASPTRAAAEKAQDFADLSKLIASNKLVRDFGVDQAVKSDYETAWDKLNVKECTISEPIDLILS